MARITLKLDKTIFKEKTDTEILGNKELTSDIYNLINKILITVFPNINGFQIFQIIGYHHILNMYLVLNPKSLKVRDFRGGHLP